MKLLYCIYNATIQILYIRKLFKVEKFSVVELNCNLLENNHGCMVVLCGQTVLPRGIITILLWLPINP